MTSKMVEKVKKPIQ